MPFVKRVIQPGQIRRHESGDNSIFEDHEEVVNHALVKALRQLSSLTVHAEDIFKEIEDEFTITFRRCERVNERLNKLFETTNNLNPKEVQIPLSDLDTEQKIPVYLHYHSCDSVEDDLFTTDTRTPCLIHLHTMAGGDLNGILQGSKAYAKSARPKSFDPKILLQDSSSSRKFSSSKSTTNIIASPELNELYNPQQILPTPRQKMEQDSSQHQAQVVTVDTSGVQFERRANLRRSQRSSNSSVRRKSQQKFRERHRTLTAMPGCISQELAPRRIRLLRPSGISRPNSLHSDVNSNSSFLGEGSVLSDFSGSPRAESRNAEIQTEEVKILPATPNKRKLKYRYSSPTGKSAPTTPSGGARVTLQDTNDVTRTQPIQQVVHNNNFAHAQPRVSAAMTTNHVINGYKNDFMREKNSLGDDRLSSGFWSGTESTRHSATSDILLQHHNVTLALQQVLTNKKSPQDHQITGSRDQGYKNVSRDQATSSPLADTKIMSLSTSTLSINSHLSTLDQSIMSSVVSLSQSSVAPASDVSANLNYVTDASSYVPRSEMGTPCQLTFGTPAGAYNFMNPNYEETKPNFGSKMESPMDPLILGNRRRNDGMMRDDSRSLNSSVFSQDQDGYYTSMHKDSGVDRRLDSVRNTNSPGTFYSEPTPDVFSSTPVEAKKQFFGNDFAKNENRLSARQSFGQQSQIQLQPQQPQTKINPQNNFQNELNQKLARRKTSPQKPKGTNSSRPFPPRRASSLRSPRNDGNKDHLVYMEPLSDDSRDVGDGCVVKTILSPRTSVVNSAQQPSYQPPLSTIPLNIKNGIKVVENSHHSPTKPYRKPSRADSFKRAISKPTQRPGSMMEPTKHHISPRRPLSVSGGNQISTPLRLSPNAYTKSNSPTDNLQQDVSLGVDQSKSPSISNNSNLKLNEQLSQQKNSPNISQDKVTPTKIITNGYQSPNHTSPNKLLQERKWSPERKPPSPKKVDLPTKTNITTNLTKSQDKQPTSPIKTKLLEKQPLSPTIIPTPEKKLLSNSTKTPEPQLPNKTPSAPVSPATPVSPKVKPVMFQPRPWSPGAKSTTYKPLPTATITTKAPENKAVPTDKIPSPKTPTTVKPAISKKPTNLPTSPRGSTNNQSAPLKQLNQNSKPLVKPKPLPKPKPSVPAKENKQNGEQQQTAINKQDRVSVKNASARAAFFGQFNDTDREMGKSISKNKKSKEQISPVNNNVEVETKEVVNLKELPKDSVVNQVSPKEEKLVTIPEKEKEPEKEPRNENTIFTFPESNNKTEVEPTTPIAKTPEVNGQQPSPSNLSTPVSQALSEQRKSPVSTSIDFAKTDVTSDDVLPNKNTEPEINEFETDIDSVPVSKPKIVSKNIPLSPVVQKTTKPEISASKSILSSELRASVQRLRNNTRTPTSPISSPSSGSVGESPALSPVSTLERRKNGRYSLSSLDRRRRITSGGTSRDDFKALLLQSFSRSSGSSMSATEKLALSNQQLNRSFSDGDDLKDKPRDTPRPVSIASPGDIKAAMNSGRHGRRNNRYHSDHKLLNGSGGFASLKHSHPSSSARRYGTRSRTPTRPMMSITEESDVSPQSSDKLSNQRSASVSNL